MPQNFRRWINERWPLSIVLRWGSDEKIVGGSRLAYVFGSSLLFLFILQVVTGVWQMLYYAPTTDHAYQSVSYLRFEVPFGWLVHGLHYWGSNAFIVLLGLHTLRVFIWGAYKRPRELIWLSGVMLLLMGIALEFSGALLPWDMMGYWAAEVGSSIAGTTPLIGDFLQRLLRGGESMGQLALSRFFAFHVAILPAAAIWFLLIHLIAFRQFGSVGPWREEKRKVIGEFWPDQTFKDLLVVLGILVLLIGLCTYLPAPISGPADPLDSSYSPKPEWPFLFLYQALKAFHGRWEPLGTVGIPLVLVLVLVLLPFVDRGPERSPRRRPAVMTIGACWVIGLLTLTVIGHYSNPDMSRVNVSGPVMKAKAQANTSVGRGERLFASSGCAACHSVTGEAGLAGPDLSTEAAKGHARQWLIAQIRNPRLSNPKTPMPSYGALAENEVNDIVDYILALPKSELLSRPQVVTSQPTSAPALPASQPIVTAQPVNLPSWGQQGPSGAAATMVGDPGHGMVLYAQNCQSCHGSDGEGHIANPGSADMLMPPLKKIDPAIFNADPTLFAQNVDRFTQHGSHPEGPSPAFNMPAFGDTRTLTQQQIANIEAYLLQLNGVDRATIVHPGVQPRIFFRGVSIAFVLVCLGLAVAALGRRRG
jgi:ubiquinol-cytochrome c reductase cytochrome b subunit